MTRVLILGGGGMVGQKLAQKLEAEGLDGTPVQLTLHDMAFPEGGAGTDRRVGNLSVAAEGAALAAERFDVIYFLASIVSGEAETNFDLGWQVNMLPMWHFLWMMMALSSLRRKAR